MLIFFFGPDGAGKSTLAFMLKNNLIKDKKMKAKISWIRGTHTLALLIANFLARFNNMKGHDNPYFHIKIKKGDKIWQSIEFISLFPIIISRFIIPKLFGYNIIAERSFIDSIVWITLTTNDSEFIKGLYAKFLISITLKYADIIVYVKADPEILYIRRLDEKIDKKFLITQIKFYDLLYCLIKSNFSKKIILLNTSNKERIESLVTILKELKDFSLYYFQEK